MTNQNSPAVGAPCWIDLWTTDVEGSRRFYSKLFNWDAREPSAEFGGYWMFDRAGAPTAGGMGSMGDMVADNAWKPYFCTEDVEATLEKAEASGAIIRGGAMPVADLGIQAVLTDPTGATFGLWQPGTFDGFHVVEEHGAPSWFELHTTDHPRAVAFYRDLFGYEILPVSDTDDFRYITFQKPGADHPFGGIMESRRHLPEHGGAWAVYWYVDDAVSAAETVTSLGGTVKQGPDQTPYGVVVVCTDPAGAEFMLRAAR